MMADPITELQRARIRYLSAFVRGEITDVELKRKLAMVDRSEQRLANVEQRLLKAREATRSWRSEQKLKVALRRSLEVSDGL